MKTKHIVISAVVLAVLALIAAVANAYSKNKATNLPAPELPANGTVPATTTPAALQANKKLGIGSKGEEVKALQLLFNASTHTPKLVADGAFGAKTLNAVVKVMGFGTLSTTLAAFKTKIETQVVSKTASDSFYKSLIGL